MIESCEAKIQLARPTPSIRKFARSHSLSPSLSPSVCPSVPPASFSPSVPSFYPRPYLFAIPGSYYLLPSVRFACPVAGPPIHVTNLERSLFPPPKVSAARGINNRQRLQATPVDLPLFSFLLFSFDPIRFD
ncbi:hypothetical protein BO99DRAFT_227085 [Aspergillus violaceofuscus CBS 115571]|uniref:Uncharacterized protein n=1 Tax=Aspergillus violaceofuscus (strain CBS 115571) TaxID=1450538 RepID=A0A2V5H695_ASPV1|nr:hypothetical protein BO99DRAFT_227085 [Aspergillus violaceofuscus CBS 115571]